MSLLTAGAAATMNKMNSTRKPIKTFGKCGSFVLAFLGAQIGRTTFARCQEVIDPATRSLAFESNGMPSEAAGGQNTTITLDPLLFLFGMSRGNQHHCGFSIRQQTSCFHQSQGDAHVSV